MVAHIEHAQQELLHGGGQREAAEPWQGDALKLELAVLSRMRAQL
jgi:hypothetical protein